MNVYVKSFSPPVISYIKESLLPVLTSQQGRIMLIAAALFAAFSAAWVLVKRCFLQHDKVKSGDVQNLNRPRVMSIKMARTSPSVSAVLCLESPKHACLNIEGTPLSSPNQHSNGVSLHVGSLKSSPSPIVSLSPLPLEKNEQQTIQLNEVNVEKPSSPSISIDPPLSIKVEKEHEAVSQIPFAVIYKVFAGFKQSKIDMLRKEVEEYNCTHEEKLKIAFGDEFIPDYGKPIWVGYSADEMNILLTEMPDCEFLTKYFYNGKGNIFEKSQYISSFTAHFVDEPSIDNIRMKYEQMKKIEASSLKVELPATRDFSGDSEEIEAIFAALLKEHEGVVVGEFDHQDQVPKDVLQDQMQNLAHLGVKTLFLEHCCYDSIQSELDLFFETKKASPFLEKFLRHGFGSVGPKWNYYDMVKAAVDAGIRPIGLEKANTKLIGYQSCDNGAGTERMLGLNVGAAEIIEKHKKEGKYIALVGSAHLSYFGNIAGLSELCAVPSLSIQSSSKMEYQTDVKNLGFTGSEVQKIFGNDQHEHFAHVQLKLVHSFPY